MTAGNAADSGAKWKFSVSGQLLSKTGADEPPQEAFVLFNRPGVVDQDHYLGLRQTTVGVET